MLTAADYIAQMRHALGKTPSAQLNLFEVFNRAGRALVTCHDWTWRDAVATLPAVADQNWVALPEDYGRFLSVTVPASGSYPSIVVVSLAEIARRRAMLAQADNSGVVHMALPTRADRANLEVASTYKAELWPTPTTAASPTITLRYLRGWSSIPSADPNRVPDIPEYFEQALADIARVYVALQENFDPNDPRPMPDVREMPEVRRLMAEDGSRGGWGGPPKGGVGTRMSQRRSFENLNVPLNVN